MPCGKRDDAGIIQSHVSQAAHQSRFRGGVAAELARVDITMRHAMLQRYLPAPSRRLSRGARKGKQLLLTGGLGDDGAVAGQIIRPVHGTDPQRLADQTPAETSAVNEEVALDFLPIGKRHASNETVVALLYLCHFAFDTLEAARLGVVAQVAGDQ